MLKKNAAGVPSLSPLPPHLAVFFCSHLCALSPRSERTEQANVLYRASRHAFLLHEPRGTGTRNKAPRTHLHEVNLPSETLKEKTYSMANLFSFLLPLCALLSVNKKVLRKRRLDPPLSARHKVAPRCTFKFVFAIFFSVADRTCFTDRRSRRHTDSS